ncbi:MAG: hypothetical protein IJ301_05615 [Clostridia bacterium]|nr:hypothetical protein [Clostridia bacterium]
MAKKKKVNFSVWSIPALIGAILLIVAACVGIFTGVVKILGVNSSTGVGLFADVADLNAGAYGILVSVFITIALVLVAVYLVATIMNMLGIGKAELSTKIINFVSGLMFVLFVGILLCGIIFITQNQAVNDTLATGVQITGGLGFYLALAGTLLIGIFGLMQTKK